MIQIHKNKQTASILESKLKHIKQIMKFKLWVYFVKTPRCYSDDDDDRGVTESVRRIEFKFTI
jgi:hypothetical protein